MDKKRQILEFRNRLDKTLASPAFTNYESIKSLVKNQLLRSSACEIEGDIGDVVQRRTLEVSNFLEMLRSASGNECESLKNGTPRKDWKLKQDDDQIRVMYREGPEGTPFHTLLAEGYVNGPIDVCLCVSWESTLYKKWWPQFNIPPFKITMSTCLQKVRIGEEISLVRVKVPWPVSAREALLHYFEVEYFEDGLIIVLINTVSDTQDIDIRTHGFSKDGIPEANDMVRVGLVGGFALQKVNSNKSYFRTIANLDIKLDFVPPQLINFVARQLIGSGFKLYQKAVASVANGDEDFSKILEDGSMYARIRKGLQSYSEGKDPESLSNKKSLGIVADHKVKMADSRTPVIEHTLASEIEEGVMHFQHRDALKSNDSHKDQEAPEKVESTSIFIREHETTEAQIPMTGKTCTQEVETSTAIELRENSDMDDGSPMHLIAEQYHGSSESSLLSPEVEQALGILDKALALVRGHGYSNDQESSPDNKKSLNLGTVAKSSMTSSQDGGVAPMIGHMDKPYAEANGSSVIDDVSCRSGADDEADDSRRASALGSESHPSKIQQGGLVHANIVEAPVPQRMLNGVHLPAIKDNGTHENGRGNAVNDSRKKSRQKNCRFCWC